MDTDRLLDVAPHYIAMFLLVYLVLGIIRMTMGPIGFWAELVVIVAVVFAYRPLVQYLGVGPDAWSSQK